MTREIRVTKDERAGLIMKHVDSPRPFIHQKTVQYDRKDQNLSSRLSCDGRESQYSLKSTFKVKELPRLSLDSKQKSNQSNEPGSNKRPSSSVVARLMGLESLTDSINEVETLKIKPAVNNQLVLGSRKQNHVSASSDRRFDKSTMNKEAPARAKNEARSVYGEIEKRLSALEFKTSGKDLRALKQILESMQTTKRELGLGLENKVQSLDSPKRDQPGSPKIKWTNREPLNQAVKPVKITTESMMILGLDKVNNVTKKQVKDPTSINKKATGRTLRSLSPSNSLEYVTRERPVSSPRLQRSKIGVDKQRFHGPSSDSTRIKKQTVVSDLKTKSPKTKPVSPMPNNEQSCSHSIKTRNLSQNGDQPKNNFAKRLIEDNPMVEIKMEQPSPVSVLDAFYTEDAPSPVKKKPNAFDDNENLHSDETERNQVGIYKTVNSTDTDQVKLENRNRLIHQIELLNSVDADMASPFKSTNEDHRYINEILIASGFLNDLDSAIRIIQLHPTCGFIKPEVFNLLEKKNPRSKSNEIIRRKMIFDSVNEVLFHKLGLWNGKGSRRLLNGEKLLKELCSEIDNLQIRSKSNRCLLYDEDDEIKNLVSADVNNNNSEDWEKCGYEVPGLVLDIERLIFKDLIDEVVNADVASVKDRSRRHCRRLFSM